MASQIAIDMGGTNLRVARIKNGKIITQLQEPCKAFGTKNEVLEQLYRMISQLNNGRSCCSIHCRFSKGHYL